MLRKDSQDSRSQLKLPDHHNFSNKDERQPGIVKGNEYGNTGLELVMTETRYERLSSYIFIDIYCIYVHANSEHT
jgi:hypothetical protein